MAESIVITGKTDLDALRHLQTVESVADRAINELTIHQTIAEAALKDLGVRTKEAKRFKRAFIFSSIAAGFWFAAAMFWMWRAVR